MQYYSNFSKLLLIIIRFAIYCTKVATSGGRCLAHTLLCPKFDHRDYFGLHHTFLCAGAGRASPSSGLPLCCAVTDNFTDYRSWTWSRPSFRENVLWFSNPSHILYLLVLCGQSSSWCLIPALSWSASKAVGESSSWYWICCLYSPCHCMHSHCGKLV